MGLFDFVNNDVIDFNNLSANSKTIILNNIIKNNKILTKCLEFSNDDNLKNDIEKCIEGNSKLISYNVCGILNEVKNDICEYLTNCLWDIYSFTKGKKHNYIIISIQNKLLKLKDEWDNASFDKMENELKSITLNILDECKADILKMSDDYKIYIDKLMNVTTYFGRIKSKLNNNFIFK